MASQHKLDDFFGKWKRLEDDSSISGGTASVSAEFIICSISQSVYKCITIISYRYIFVIVVLYFKIVVLESYMMCILHIVQNK